MWTLHWFLFLGKSIAVSVKLMIFVFFYIAGSPARALRFCSASYAAFFLFFFSLRAWNRNYNFFYFVHSKYFKIEEKFTKLKTSKIIKKKNLLAICSIMFSVFMSFPVIMFRYLPCALDCVRILAICIHEDFGGAMDDEIDVEVFHQIRVNRVRRINHHLGGESTGQHGKSTLV